MEALVGKNIKAYEVRAIIGHGGFGTVYRAYQANIEREVAIKSILPAFANKPEFIRQFDVEARVIARLEHPFIVPLFDYWREPDAAYLVMRYFAAGSLAKSLKTQKNLPLKRAAQLLEQVASALDIAHQHDIIHLDIKPDNILMDAQGNAYLGDFGVARTLSEQNPKDGHATGSVAYMSPEMLRGERLMPQSDIYSLALVVYEMIVGNHPFVDADTKPLSVSDLMMAQLMDFLPSIPNVPDGINLVLQRASAKDPEDRYPNARLFAQALREVLAAESLLSLSEIEELEQSVALSNPYKGLEAFGEGDAQNFFGRESLVQDLVAHVQAYPFLAVVGPSGSGKSSVVHAGLLPKLRQGAIAGSDSWFIVSMKPDHEPMRQLESALRSIAINSPSKLEETLQTQGIEATLDSLLPNQPTLLLVIDQFEEVFTQSTDKERSLFLKILHDSTTKPESRVRVVLSLRADFYDRPLLYETFGKLIQAHTQVILPLSREEIRAAILRPAERAGLQVEPALVTAILADLSAEVGALPLLQYALTELFQRRDGRKLSLEAYQASGGVLGALARRADEVYLSLSADNQAIAKQIFLRLVTLGEGTEDTRRRVRLVELTSLLEERANVQVVNDIYGKYRLLSFDRDTESRAATVEIAHEALIREWKRLQRWLAENRNDIRLQRLLTGAASDWKTANNDSSYLLSGSRLAQYEDWIGTSKLSLSQEEEAFLQASSEARKYQESILEMRKEHERRLDLQLRQRLQAIIVILVLASIGGIILTGFIYQQSQVAAAERDVAERNAIEANSLALATNAQQAYATGDSLLALSLALEAASIPNPPIETYSTLLNIAYAPNLRQVFSPIDRPINAMALSPDGQWVLLGAGASPLPRPGAERVGSPLPQGGNPPPEGGANPAVQGGANEVADDGPRIPPWLRQPPADESPYANNPLLLFNLETGEIAQTFAGHQASISDVIFIEGNRAASVSLDGLVFVWDLTTNEMLYQFTVPRSRNITLSADSAGQSLLVSMNGDLRANGGHILFDLATGTEIRRIDAKTSGLWAGALFPDGQHGLSLHWDGLVIVWDSATGEEVQRLEADFDLQRHESYQAIISANGEQVVINGVGETLVLWDWQANTTTTVTSPSERPHRVGLDSDGQTLIWVTQSGVIDVWNVAEGSLATRLLSNQSNVWTNQMELDAAAQTLVLGFENGTIEVWDLYTSANNQLKQLTSYPILHNAAYLPDSRTVLAFGSIWLERAGNLPREIEPRLLLWDSETGQVQREFLGQKFALSAMALSADTNFALSASDANIQGMTGADGNSEMILWDVQTGAELWRNEFEGEAAVTALAFDPNNSQRAIANRGDNILLWDLATGEILQTYAGHRAIVRQAIFSPDGQGILSSSVDGRVLLWDAVSGDILQELTVGVRSEFLLFHPDQTMALTASQDSTMTLWDLATAEAIQVFTGHESFVRDAVFSADASRLWSASEDGVIIAWDVASGAELYQYSVPAAQFWDIDLSPDGESLLSVTSDSLIVWRSNPLPLDEILAWTAANRFLRPLTAVECRRYHLDDCNQ